MYLHIYLLIYIVILIVQCILTSSVNNQIYGRDLITNYMIFHIYIKVLIFYDKDEMTHVDNFLRKIKYFLTGDQKWGKKINSLGILYKLKWFFTAFPGNTLDFQM